MKQCHYINDPEVGKVLIPGCMGTAVHNDMFFCTCDNREIDIQIKELQKKIKELRKLKTQLRNEKE